MALEILSTKRVLKVSLGNWIRQSDQQWPIYQRIRENNFLQENKRVKSNKETNIVQDYVNRCEKMSKMLLRKSR